MVVRQPRCGAPVIHRASAPATNPTTNHPRMLMTGRKVSAGGAGDRAGPSGPWRSGGGPARPRVPVAPPGWGGVVVGVGRLPPRPATPPERLAGLGHALATDGPGALVEPPGPGVVDEPELGVRCVHGLIIGAGCDSFGRAGGPVPHGACRPPHAVGRPAGRGQWGPVRRSPTTPATIRPRHSSRVGEAGSPRRMPTTAVPRAPMPTHTA